MAVGKASIKRAVDAGKAAAKTEPVKDAALETKVQETAAKKPAAAKRTGNRKAKAAAKKPTEVKEQVPVNRPIRITEEMPVYLL